MSYCAQGIHDHLIGQRVRGFWPGADAAAVCRGIYGMNLARLSDFLADRNALIRSLERVTEPFGAAQCPLVLWKRRARLEFYER